MADERHDRAITARAMIRTGTTMVALRLGKTRVYNGGAPSGKGGVVGMAGAREGSEEEKQRMTAVELAF